MRQASESSQNRQLGEIAPDELEQILRRIDENLARSPLLSKQGYTRAASGDIDVPPPMPEIGDLSWRMQELLTMRAPLFVVKGRDWRNQLKRLMNLPIRVLSYKQISFNRQILEVLNMMIAPLQHLPQQADYQAQLGQALHIQQQQLQSLQRIVQSLAEQIGHQNQTIEQQDHELRRLRADMAASAELRSSDAAPDAGR